MLTDRLDHIEGPPPLMRGAFVDVYKAMHKGHPMVAKAFKITSAESLESLQKVSGLIFDMIEQDTYITSSAPREGDRSMEMASTRECLTIYWDYFNPTAHFDCFALDGEWDHRGFHEGPSRAEPIQSRAFFVFRIGTY